MTDVPPLYKHLQRQPSAPSTGFDRFVVGDAAKRRSELVALSQRMLACKEPSCGRLLLAANGNGKTLLKKSLQEAATEVNLKNLDVGARPSFRIMFSRISVSQTTASNIGLELAKGLRRSYKEPSTITYTSLGVEILRKYEEGYKSPLAVRWLIAPVKFGLKYSLKKYDDYIRDIIEQAAEEVADGGVDKVFKRVDGWLRRLGLEHDFRRFARSQKMSHFLETYIAGEQSGYRSVEELNNVLYNDLAATFGKGQPQDMVSTIAGLVGSVGCELLILQLDDCNDSEAIDFLLPLAENLEDFRRPKLLIIASAVPDKWEKIVDQGEDLSARHKLELFFDPIRLSSPGAQELRELAGRLEVLIQAEEAVSGRTLSWPVSTKEAAIERCAELTYREATKELINSAEEHLSAETVLV